MVALWLWINNIAVAISGASAARRGARPRLAKLEATRRQTKQKVEKPSTDHLFVAWLNDTVSYYH
jgi:hypothetical protein